MIEDLVCCKDCKKFKPLIEFQTYRYSNGRPDGRKSNCKTCCVKRRKIRIPKGEDRPCSTCGKVFRVDLQQLRRSKNYFCCPEHHREWQRKDRPKLTCRQCGKEFSRRRGLLLPGTAYCSQPCYRADPKQNEDLRKRNAEQHFSKRTKLEITGYKLLESLGLTFEIQHIIKGSFCVDAFVTNLNLVVQFDGDYWHGNPNSFPFPTSKQLQQQKRDKTQDAYLTACGKKVVRFWETEIYKTPDLCCERLRAFM